MADAGDFIIEGGKLIRNLHEITQSHKVNKSTYTSKHLFHNLSYINLNACYLNQSNLKLKARV